MLTWVASWWLDGQVAATPMLNSMVLIRRRHRVNRDLSYASSEKSSRNSCKNCVAVMAKQSWISARWLFSLYTLSQKTLTHTFVHIFADHWLIFFSIFFTNLKNFTATFTMYLVWPLMITLLQTSYKYPSFGRKKNYRASRSNSLGPCGPPVRSFISIHQVAAATALLLLVLILPMRACFIVIRQVSQAWILYTARIDKWPWPWHWLKHSLGQHESLCQVWSWSAQPFGRPSATDRQINRHIAFYYVDLSQNLAVNKCYNLVNN